MGSAAELLPPPGEREREAGAAPVRHRRSPEEQVGAAGRGRLGRAGGKERAGTPRCRSGPGPSRAEGARGGAERSAAQLAIGLRGGVRVV